MRSYTFGSTEQPALDFPLQPYPTAHKQLCPQLASNAMWDHPETTQGVSAHYAHRSPYIKVFFNCLKAMEYQDNDQE